MNKKTVYNLIYGIFVVTFYSRLYKHIYKNAGLKKLKEQNILERIGSKKCGYWKVKW